MADNTEEKKMDGELQVFLMTLTGNLVVFVSVILMFNKIRKWRGDEDNRKANVHQVA